MKNKKVFYTWLLPVVWTTCSLMSYQFPGDEYGGYAISSIAGIWIAFFIKNINIHDPILPISVAATGAIVMTGIGFLMDRLKVNKLIWAIIGSLCAITIFILSIISFRDRHLGITAFFYSINMGLYFSIFMSVFIAMARWLWKTMKKK
jgi:hypothetical protein